MLTHKYMQIVQAILTSNYLFIEDAYDVDDKTAMYMAEALTGESLC